MNLGHALGSPSVHCEKDLGAIVAGLGCNFQNYESCKKGIQKSALKYRARKALDISVLLRFSEQEPLGRCRRWCIMYPSQ